MNKRVIRGLTASAAIAGSVVVGATVAAPANAFALPGAATTKNVDGGSVSIRLYDESATISRAVTNIPTSREVMVSGKIGVVGSGNIKGGTVKAGYIVGCQVNFGAGAGANGAISGAPDLKAETYNFKADPKDFGGNGTITLSPGQAAYASVINSAIGSDPVTSFTFKNAQGGMAYSGQKFGVDGCAGFAQARAQVTVQVSTDTFKGNVTLYGKPFSIG